VIFPNRTVCLSGDNGAEQSWTIRVSLWRRSSQKYVWVRIHPVDAERQEPLLISSSFSPLISCRHQRQDNWLNSSRPKVSVGPRILPHHPFFHFSYKWKIYGYSLKIKNIVHLNLLFKAMIISWLGNEYSEPGVLFFSTEYGIDPRIHALNKIVNSILTNGLLTLVNGLK
jgi:hypothetical protein